jgi:hypothetical protein
MTDRKFLELLNLYLDDEISPGDAAALEQEIHSNPDRRRLYRTYCQMQRACVLLTDRYRAQDTVEVRAFAPAARSRRFGWPALAYGLSGAVAACLLVAVVVLTPFDGTAPGSSERAVAGNETTNGRPDAAAVATTRFATSESNGSAGFYSPEEARFPSTPPPAAYVLFENPWRRTSRDSATAVTASPLTPLQSDFGRPTWDVPGFTPVNFGQGGPTIFVGRERPGATTVDFTAFPFQR